MCGISIENLKAGLNTFYRSNHAMNTQMP